MQPWAHPQQSPLTVTSYTSLSIFNSNCYSIVTLWYFKPALCYAEVNTGESLRTLNALRVPLSVILCPLRWQMCALWVYAFRYLAISLSLSLSLSLPLSLSFSLSSTPSKHHFHTGRSDMSIVWGDSAASESVFRIRKHVRPSSCSPAHRRIPPRISEFRGTGRFFRHATIRAPGSYPWQRLFSPEAPLLTSGRRISNNNERNDARAFNLQRTILRGQFDRVVPRSALRRT